MPHADKLSNLPDLIGQAKGETADIAGVDRSVAILSVLLTGLLTVMAFAAPAGVFYIDEMIYVHMARAMAEHESLAVAANTVPPGLPAPTPNYIYAMPSGLYPQYPSGYGFFAAPFYALMGIPGLGLMNALATGVSLILCWRIALQLYGDRRLARTAVWLLVLGTYAATYGLGVWPHMFALSFILWGADLSLQSTRGTRIDLTKLAASGLIFGLAMNIRVDAVFLAAAVFVWLRLFAAPSHRIAAVVFIVGTIPGLIASAIMNYIKFGEIAVFTYGPKTGIDTVAEYTPVVLAIGALSIALIAVDFGSPRLRGLVEKARLKPYAAAVAFVLSLGAALILLEPFRNYLFNLWVLVGDLQQLDPNRFVFGVERRADGYISFWGVNKRALLQSAPLLVLALIPVGFLAVGREVRAHAFALGLAAAPIAFYAINQWHGGLCFSLRYFLPSLPFMAILTAAALRELGVGTPAMLALIRRNVSIALTLGLPFAIVVVYFKDHVSSGLQLYPQLAIAALLLVSALIAYMRPSAGVQRVLCASTGAAIAASILVNVLDVGTYLAWRKQNTFIDNETARAIPRDALVLTVVEENFLRHSLEGGAVMAVLRSPADAARVAAAWQEAGRCVYLFLPETLQVVAPFLKGEWISTTIPRLGGKPDLLHQPASQRLSCMPR